MVAVRYGNASKEQYAYGTGADANLLLSKTDRDGMVTMFGYDAAGRETSRIEGAQDPAVAITTTTAYLEGTDLPQTVTRGGQKTEYVYDTRKRVVETRRWVDGTRYLAERTVYDAADRVAYTQDAFGRRTYSVYDDLDRVERTVREAVAGGVPADNGVATPDELRALVRLAAANAPYVIEETSYDAGGRVLSTTDARGIVTQMGYDRLGRLTDRWEAFGTADEGHWQWTYDDAGNRETETDPLGRITTWQYTGRNLVASQTVATGTPDEATTSFTYSPTGQRQTQTDANGQVSRWDYGNCCDWLENSFDAAEYITHYTYTKGGLVQTVTDPNLHTVRTDYDGLKRPALVTNGDNEPTATSYDDDLTDALGLSGTYADQLSLLPDLTGFRAVAQTNALGETVVRVSDGLGRAVLAIDAEGHVTRMTYDEQVTLDDDSVVVATTTIDPLGNVTRQDVDGLGRVRRIVDAEGAITTFAYDANGNRVAVVDPLGHGQTALFDQRNRQISSTDAAGNTTGVGYDAVGNVLRRTDARLKDTLFTYTARNQKKTEKDRLGNTTVFTYDPAGNLLTISDADNEARKATVSPEVYEAGKTRYTWDERNQMATQTLPGPTGGVVALSYWPNGQEKTRTDQRGIVRTSVYDAANRLTDRTYSDGTADHFVLDDAGRVTSATASRSGVVVGRTYYPTGLIKSETTTWPAGINGTSTSATVNYEYDAANRSTILTLPDGRTLDRTFTARNQLESLTIGGQAIATLGYDNAGRRTSALFGNGLSDSRAYTDNNLLKTTEVGPAAAPLLSLEYAYDLNNRKTAETDHRDGALSISMGYDDNDRLTSWTTGGSPRLPASQTWDLSAVGDWNKTTVDGVIENREHTAVHEVKTRDGTPVGYDAAGNLILTASGQTFAWDAENRLLAADTAPNADGAKDRVVYQTDAFGRRVAKSVYGSTYLAIHDGWQVIQELDAPYVATAAEAASDGPLTNLATVPDGALLYPTYDADGNRHDPTRINFQPETAAIPEGFIADKGRLYDANVPRTNGLTYGWLDTTGRPSHTIRHFHPLPQYDTFGPVADGSTTWTWQMALPNGTYPVAIVAGDATSLAHTNNLVVNGQALTPDPDPGDDTTVPTYEQGDFDGWLVPVQVTNGVLTITAGAGAFYPTLTHIEIGIEGQVITPEMQTRLADQILAATKRTGGSPFWNGGRSEIRTYVWGSGIDELVAYQRTNDAGMQTYYAHNNSTWSVMAVTDESGQVVERYSYTATGKRGIDSVSNGGRSIIGLTTGWTGRAHDEATGTIYFRGREWEPDYQFMNRDPLGYKDGMSLYRGYFVPNKVDPTGYGQTVIIGAIKWPNEAMRSMLDAAAKKLPGYDPEWFDPAVDNELRADPTMQKSGSAKDFYDIVMKAYGDCKRKSTAATEEGREAECCIENLIRDGHASALLGGREGLDSLTQAQIDELANTLCVGAKITDAGCYAFDRKKYPGYEKRALLLNLLTRKGGQYRGYHGATNQNYPKTTSAGESDWTTIDIGKGWTLEQVQAAMDAENAKGSH